MRKRGERRYNVFVRLDAETHKILERAAQLERRSINNMMEVALIDYAERRGIKAEPEQAPA